jgi:hypothetical protein
MKKAGKKILAVMLLMIFVLLFGCFVYTSNRLTGYPKDLTDYERVVFTDKDGTMVAFTEDGAWYDVGDEMILLEIIDYFEGVITMERNDTEYRFFAVDRDTIYDEATNSFFVRRSGSG